MDTDEPTFLTVPGMKQQYMVNINYPNNDERQAKKQLVQFLSWAWRCRETSSRHFARRAEITTKNITLPI